MARIFVEIILNVQKKVYEPKPVRELMTSDKDRLNMINTSLRNKNTASFVTAFYKLVEK